MTPVRAAGLGSHERRPLDRLSPFDLMFLRLESIDQPCHFGGLAILDGERLPAADDALPLGEILARLDRRVARVPRLRQRVHRPGLLRGRPLWVDDAGFDIRDHIRTMQVEPPGGPDELLDAAATAYGQLLDRHRPLWELWLLTGAGDARVGVLLKVHHAVADGQAAMAIMSALFDPEADPRSGAAADADDPDPAEWTPSPAPGDRALLADALTTRARALRAALSALARPHRAAQRARRLGRTARGYAAGKASALNRPVRAGRRVRYLTLDVPEVKDTAHARGGTLNDVVLTLWAGGLRHLLAERGEPTSTLELIAGLAASVRSPSDATPIGNRAGAFVVPLPVGEPDPRARLDTVVARTLDVKTNQRPAAIAGFLASLAGTPLGRWYVNHQRANNVVVTNVAGPTVPVHIFGARVDEVLPIIQILGNVGLTLCAFSYTGRLFLVVTADAGAFPDLDTLLTGMRRDWDALRTR